MKSECMMTITRVIFKSTRHDASMPVEDKQKKEEFLSVRVSSAAKAKLEEIAKKNDRFLSWAVAKIIEKFLKGASDKDIFWEVVVSAV